MLYTCFHITKGKIAVILSALVLSVVAVFLLCGNGDADMTKAKCREEYLSSINVKTDIKSCEKRNVIIPENFSDVYEKYNELQRESGFDIKDYKGKTVTQYTYKVKNKENTVVNLLVFDKKLIGGDICEINLGGRMYPLPV